MKDLEFPQAIVDISSVLTFCFQYADGHKVIASLENREDLINDLLPAGMQITIILNDGAFFCGSLVGMEDAYGLICVKLRSLVNISCIVSIPYNDIMGWSFMPEKQSAV